MKPTALGAYIFAGGFTLGVKQHFNVHAVLEESDYGVPTMRKNQPDVPVIVGTGQWNDAIKYYERGQLDFVYGNPPCAAWSQAGRSNAQGADWRQDPRVDCTRRHFTLLEELRPTFWAWESVTEAFVKGREFVDELTRRTNDLGYSVTYLLHNAAYLGVPQVRKRFFFVAHKIEFDVDELAWETQTCDDALRRLNDPGEPLEHNLAKHRAILPEMRPGEDLRKAWERLTPEDARRLNQRGQVAGRPPFTIKRLKAGRPAFVVMHEMVHPTEHRALSIKELALLSGYPPGYEFVGAKDAGQVGRGVCPPVGEWLARNVARCLKENRPIERPKVTLIDVREPPGSTTPLPLPGLKLFQIPAFDPIEMQTTGELIPMTTPKPAAIEATPAPPAPVGASIAVRPPRPKEGVGSGAYMRVLLAMGYDDQKILELVHEHYPASKATKSDVAWNKNRLRREQGTAVRAEVAQQHQSTAQELRTGERLSNDPERSFDKSSLRASSHGQWVHRDYGAHFFRWGFAGRFINSETDVLDVGCGPDVPMIDILTHPRSNVPKSYTGVDLNREPRKVPNRGWATLKWQFNFLEDYASLGQFDVVTNFEMIEHMYKPDGLRLLAALRECLKPSSGVLLLSTPVFNGKAAANHLHEWGIEELRDAIQSSGLTIERRHGTYASFNDLKKVATPTELALIKELNQYYSGEVTSLFLAPKYPDASRNNIWVLRRA